jgi:glycosyltransferase involved in cell wall biosynthesis
MEQNYSRFHGLIFAPMPPPVGGIASITAMLYKGMADKENILFEHPVSKNDSKKTNLSRFLANLRILFFASLKIERNGRVLFFSSAYASFWEKLIWANMVILLGKKPIIIMVDGNFPRFYSALSNPKKRLVKWLIVNKSIAIGAQSEAWCTYYSEIFPGVTIQTVSASVDEIFFSTTSNKRQDRSQINILYIGWIIEDKGVIDLLDAIELIRDRINSVKFRLVGTLFGREQFWLEELSKRKIESIVEFTGPVNSREAILSEYANADIFVFPSHYEGFPVALLEAIASGLPCIGTNVGGIPDILDSGSAGIIIKPHAPFELADAILKLTEDELVRNYFSVAAANRAKTKYNFAQLIYSYKEILEIND